MTRSERDAERSRQELLKRRARRDQKLQGKSRFDERKLPRNLAERLENARALIERGRYIEAEQAMEELDRRDSHHPDILSGLVYLYQQMKDHDQCCRAVYRLLKLQPYDPETHLMYAQESMFCGRLAIAQKYYQEFMKRWPDHADKKKAKSALELLATEVEERIADLGFDPEHGWECFLIHEESLIALQVGDYSDCAAKCLELIAKAPGFVSTRNNLAIAYFHSGRIHDAVGALEETLRRFPDNRFAEATLAKMYFLGGRVEEAYRLADEIVSHPPTHEDAIITAWEMLALLGRDQDIVSLSESAMASHIKDDFHRSAHYHFLAYAHCRLGDVATARNLWKKCLKLYSHPDARDNLTDLDARAGHAPWAAQLAKWIPKEVVETVITNLGNAKQSPYPEIAVLVPAMLDRGDALGRELALRLAMADRSPPMLAALKDFAFGPRGPDSMRQQALSFLYERKVIDVGPHRFFHQGAWTDIRLISAEITSEAQPTGSPEFQRLMEIGGEAIEKGEFSTAERSFKKATELEPTNCGAVYNLCVVWLRRDGAEGRRRAQMRLEQLHRDFPDYRFAVIALAQFASMDGEFEKAQELLKPVYLAEKLHISEAKALYATQANIAIAQGNIEAAEASVKMLQELFDNDAPELQQLRDQIRIAKRLGPSGKRSLRFDDDE
jgi:tetratricopeptide (TPR) repeat protein